VVSFLFVAACLVPQFAIRRIVAEHWRSRATFCSVKEIAWNLWFFFVEEDKKYL